MTTYAQLQTDFPLWAKRDDQGSLLPGFVALFESRMARKLRTRRQETAFTGTIASDVIALPADFLAFKTLWADGSESVALKAQSLETVAATPTGGKPTLYAVGASSVRFNGSGDVSGTYYAAVPGLVAAGSNWLSVAAYDAYLFGVLAESAGYQLDNERMGLYMVRSDAALAEVTGADQRDKFNGPLVARAR